MPVDPAAAPHTQPPTEAVFCFCNPRKPTMKTTLTLLALAAASFAVQAQQTTTVEMHRAEHAKSLPPKARQV